MITKGTAKSPNEQKPTFVEFIEFHEAKLQSGEYKINVTQTVTGPGIQKPNVFTAERNLYVTGNRFNLKPSDVFTVFPPEGSLGEYSNVLPHMVLNRSTLPWERLAIPLTKLEEDALSKPEKQRTETEQKLAQRAATKKKTPWLVLLHLSETEIVHQETTTLSKLREDSSLWPSIKHLELSQHDDDKVNVIEVSPTHLTNLMPTYDELRYQAHVRQGKDAHNKALGDEKAVLFANRLPQRGGNSVVHLVSVEHRYKETGFDTSHKNAQGNIRFVSLKSWRFASLSEKQGFKGLVTHLNHALLFDMAYTAKDVHALQQGQIPQEVHTQFKNHGYPLTPQAAVVSGESKPWCIHDQEKSYLISREADSLSVHQQDTTNSHTLRLPHVNHQTTDRFLQMGYVPCPHYFRQGDRSVSWYHSPLAPSNQSGTTVPTNLFPVRSADALLRFHEEEGMFDVSYAAAWELGRLMALKNRHFAFNLYQWKRGHVQQVKQLEQHHLYAHLPAPDMVDGQSDLPEVLEEWLGMTSLLHNVPFNYLVPDERMLPIESIRYFTLDPLWIASLLDGAFSIGRVSPADHASDGYHRQKVAAIPKQEVSGILIRSAVVAGWPDLLIDAYDYEFTNTKKEVWEIPKEPLPCLRLERLSPNVLIALFAGDIRVIDVHQKAQTIHFGVDKEIDEHGKELFSKTLRDKDGKEQATLTLSTIPFRDKDREIVNLSQLFDNVKQKSGLAGEFTAAQFAMEMVEGVQKVRLIRTKGRAAS